MKLMRQFFLEKNPEMDEQTLNSLLDSVRDYVSQYYIGSEDFTSGLNCCEVYWNQQLKEVKSNL